MKRLPDGMLWGILVLLMVLVGLGGVILGALLAPRGEDGRPSVVIAAVYIENYGGSQATDSTTGNMPPVVGAISTPVPSTDEPAGSDDPVESAPVLTFEPTAIAELPDAAIVPSTSLAATSAAPAATQRPSNPGSSARTNPTATTRPSTGGVVQTAIPTRTSTPTWAPTPTFATRTPTATRPPTNTPAPGQPTATLAPDTPTPTATATPTLTPTATVSTEPPVVEEIPADPLLRINYFREKAGVGTILFDATLSDGAQKHAEYMTSHRTISEAELSTDPMYTPEGDEAAHNSNLWYGGGFGIWTPASAIDHWMRSPYHRIWVLYPQTTQMGWGYSEDMGNRSTAAVLRVFGGWDQSIPFTEPIRYPAPNQTTIPATRFGVSLQFPIYTANPTVTSATWVDAGGNAVAFRRIDPSNDAYMRYYGNTVFLLPDAVLAPLTTYTVRIVGSYNSQPFDLQWSFSTGE